MATSPGIFSEDYHKVVNEMMAQMCQKPKLRLFTDGRVHRYIGANMVSEGHIYKGKFYSYRGLSY
jgi:hypothetical protein